MTILVQSATKMLFSEVELSAAFNHVSYLQPLESTETTIHIQMLIDYSKNSSDFNDACLLDGKVIKKKSARGHREYE